MSYETWFKSLDDNEEQAFRQWARDNYKPGDDVNALWHPVVREECGLINIRAGWSS